MAIDYLKRSKPEAEKAEEDAKVRSVVETTLRDIEMRGDAAVRDLSKKFDAYSPENFRLSDSEIEAAMNRSRRAIWKISNSRRIRYAALLRRSAQA